MIHSFKKDDHKKNIENTVLELTDWFTGNDLELNINKTKLLIFQSKNYNNMILNSSRA